MSEPPQASLVGPALADLEDDWDENDEGEYDEEDEEDADDDIDAEAEEMARKLNEQILADLRKAETTAMEALPATGPEPLSAADGHPAVPSSLPRTSSRKEEAVMATIKGILTLLNHDSVAHSTLASTNVPNSAFSNVLDALKQILASGKIAKAAALALSQTLIGLAGSEVLFGSLRRQDPALELLGKRKREEEPVVIPPAPKPPSIHDVVSNAVHIVTHTLHTSSSINPALITSIQHPLHHIFLFSISSSSKPDLGNTPSSTKSALQEISGLIQVLGVLSGIQIGVDTSNGSATATDIGTMVYPCMAISCNKTFGRLANLRNHERQHHPHTQPHPSSSFSNGITSSATSDRPCKCAYPNCSASFLRNSDLKRHVKVAHERKSFQCGGCGKTFSRRDAIKRHRDNSEAKAQKRPSALVGPPCFESQIIELEAEGVTSDLHDHGMPETKRAKIEGEDDDDDEEEEEEEGEVSESMISSTQAVVMQLHPLLRAVVAKASGASLPLMPLPSDTSTDADPSPPNSNSNLISNPTSTLIPNDPSSTASTYTLALPPQPQQEMNIINHIPSTGVTTPHITVPISSATPTANQTPAGSKPQVGSGATLTSVIARAQPPILMLAPPHLISSTPAVSSKISSSSSRSSSAAVTPASSAKVNWTSSSLSTPAPAPTGLGVSNLNFSAPSSLPSNLQSAQTSSQTQNPSGSESLSIYDLSDTQSRIPEGVIRKSTQGQAEASSESDQGRKGIGSGLNGSSVAVVNREGTTRARDVDTNPNADEDADGDSDGDGEADMDMEVVASAV